MYPPKTPAAASGGDNVDYKSFRDILDAKCQPWSFVNVAGVVVDFQAPVATRKTDWKSTIIMIDTSIQDSSHEVVTCHLFMPEDEMPRVSAGDVLVLYRVKVQVRLGDISLLSNYETKFTQFAAAKIPKAPSDPSIALVEGAKKRQRQLSKAELDAVATLYKNIDKDRIPDIETYAAKVTQSRNVKENFKVLKDVGEGVFCDIIVEIVKEPYDLGDKMSFWVSDYTENPFFYNFPIPNKNVKISDHQDGDPYGYVAKFNKKTDQEPKKPEFGGPYGKKSLQITCWDPHVSAMRHEGMTKGTWVSIKNLQVKFGRDVSNLEGYLREDRDAYGTKLGISSLDTSDRDSMDERLVAALKRRREYERGRKSQAKEIEKAAHAGQKRKSNLASEEPANNTKTKRAAKRKAQREKAAQEAHDQSHVSDGAIESKTATQTHHTKPETHTVTEPARNIPAPDLNQSVKCENLTTRPSRVADVLKETLIQTEVEELRQFVYPMKTSKYAALSDNEGSDLDSESDTDMRDGDADEREWAWQFALELEDATPDAGAANKRFWVVVDNQAAQCLLSLDASDLSSDPKNLEELRQRMFLIWGDLEEKKGARDAQRAQAQRLAHGDQPPPDSDDESGSVANSKEVKISNVPFSCCVRQYGVKVRETNPGKADAGRGHRWMRVFGMYGTRIAGVR